MKKHTKSKIRNLINLEEKDGLKKTIERLQKRYNYLNSKLGKRKESRQMKYIKFHMNKYQKMLMEDIK